jgi:hypothetical protein
LHNKGRKGNFLLWLLNSEIDTWESSVLKMSAAGEKNTYNQKGKISQQENLPNRRTFLESLRGQQVTNLL